MDIVTHAAMGTILAAPFIAGSPEAASAFLLGSVAPDLDAPGRVTDEVRHPIVDDRYAGLLGAHPDWLAIRGLSPASR